MPPFDIAIASLFLMLSPIIMAPCCARSRSLTIHLSFTLTALAALGAVVAGVLTVQHETATSAIVLMGLPDLPFHLRLDPLAGFFLCVIGLLAFFVSIYSMGYVQGVPANRPILRFIVFYCLFVAGMFMVVLADDAFFFLVAWELMAASSYFLVLYEDEKAENKRAAYLYLVIAHVGAIAILLSFGVMAAQADGFATFQGYTFDSMRSTHYPVGWATAAFLLSFFGFAAKAGVIPLHVWLPEAHPVAPSNVSALMSGVMLKTSIYGIVRITFDFLKVFPWWWGGIVLVLGLVSAVLGVLYALMQHDLKRLLAYHSVENIGIILIGLIGLVMDLHLLPSAAPGIPGTDRGALPHPESRHVQGAALHGGRGRAPCHPRAQHGGDGGAHPPHALDIGPVPGRLRLHRGTPSLQRICLGMAHLSGVSVLSSPAPPGT